MHAHACTRVNSAREERAALPPPPPAAQRPESQQPRKQDGPAAAPHHPRPGRAPTRPEVRACMHAPRATRDARGGQREQRRRWVVARFIMERRAQRSNAARGRPRCGGRAWGAMHGTRHDADARRAVQLRRHRPGALAGGAKARRSALPVAPQRAGRRPSAAARPPRAAAHYWCSPAPAPPGAAPPARW